MSWNLVGNALIGQSGGPTTVINQSLVGAIKEAKRHNEAITGFLGARHGVEGILREDFIDLFAQSAKTLNDVAKTPSAALGTVRLKPKKRQCKRIFRICQKHNVRYFFYIGGNDSAEAAHLINEIGREEGYELRLIHIPKTIDNDLRVTDHCPGYGSAAKFVAQAFMGDNLDNRALAGVKINVVMGRDAGFLTAASVLGRKYKDDGPHLVYVPEVNFNLKRFLNDVEEVYARLGRCVIAVSEGIRSGRQVMAKKFARQMKAKGGLHKKKDSHGNVQLSGSGFLGDCLANAVTDYWEKELKEEVRVRADTFGYLQRCYPGVVSEVDAKEAFEVGRAAVQLAVSGDVDGSVVITRDKGSVYQVKYELAPLQKLAKHTKSLPRHFINRDGNNITQAFVNYALPLVGKLPVAGRLEE